MLFTAFPGNYSVSLKFSEYFSLVFQSAFFPSATLRCIVDSENSVCSVRSYMEQGTHKICKSRLLLLPSLFKIPFLLSVKKVTWIFCFLKLTCSFPIGVISRKAAAKSKCRSNTAFYLSIFHSKKLAAHQKREAQKGAISCLGLYSMLVTARCRSGPQWPIPNPESREGVIPLGRIHHPWIQIPAVWTSTPELIVQTPLIVGEEK